MPRVTPSQAVALIELMFPKHIAQKAGEKRPLTQDHQPLLAAMLEVIDHIPDELILLDGSDFVEYVSSIAAIRQSVEMWNTNVNWSLIFVRGIRQLSPVTIIRDLLRKCPEEMPAPGTAELGFISAEDTRDALRMDIGAVTQAFANGEWKAATVLAGSVIEALLFWALDAGYRPRLKDSYANCLKGRANDDLESWNLHQYCEVAADLKVITETTAAHVRLAKDHRNLIHAGRVARKQEKCDRSTAMTAIAALDRVTADLTAKFSVTPV